MTPASLSNPRAQALQARFLQGIELHRHGRLAEAEQIYRLILKLEPSHAGAVSALGTIFLQYGQFEAAERQLAVAIGMNPNDPLAYVNRGLALKELGRHYEALASCQKAILLDPGNADAYCNCGLALRELNRLDEALTGLDRAIALRPAFPDALSNRGIVLKDLGRLDEALRSLERAIALRPDSREALNNHGLVLHDLERYAEAIASFDRAISLDPGYAAALNNRGLALTELDRFDEAVESLDQAVMLKPDSSEIWHNRVRPLTAVGRLEEALVSCDRALALEPDHVGAHYNRGRVLGELQRSEEALASLDRAIALKPDYYQVYIDRSMTKLLMGRFPEGWDDFEVRWHSEKFRARSGRNIAPELLTLHASRDNLHDSCVLVVAEQGVGDEIMFSSMIPDLMRDTRNAVLECDRRLLGLFTRSFPGMGVYARNNDQPTWRKADYDLCLPAGSLGRLYRNSAGDFPDRDHYLETDAAIVSKWKDRLSTLGGTLKVGISWRGGIKLTNRSRRSIPLQSLRPLLETEGVDFISLQYGDEREEIDEVNASLSRPITYFGPDEIDDFDQLAGLVSGLDLVISVQTALVHLCGAIGHRCWCLVPQAAEWRYGQEGSSMPWYRSVKLYRQRERGQWDETIGQVAGDLSAMRDALQWR
jgi:tetratricopeptide (TPR) repeat protein